MCAPRLIGAKLRSQEPLRTGGFFLGVVVTEHHLRCLISDAPIVETRMRAHERAAVTMFLARYHRESGDDSAVVGSAAFERFCQTSCRINEGLPRGTSVALT